MTIPTMVLHVYHLHTQSDHVILCLATLMFGSRREISKAAIVHECAVTAVQYHFRTCIHTWRAHSSYTGVHDKERLTVQHEEPTSRMIVIQQHTYHTCTCTWMCSYSGTLPLQDIHIMTPHRYFQHINTSATAHSQYNQYVHFTLTYNYTLLYVEVHSSMHTTVYITYYYYKALVHIPYTHSIHIMTPHRYFQHINTSATPHSQYNQYAHFTLTYNYTLLYVEVLIIISTTLRLCNILL